MRKNKMFSKNFEIKTKLSVKEIINKSLNYIGDGKYTGNIFSRQYIKKYKGYINEQNFEIRRNIEGRNSFRPVITGIINEKECETTIIVNMKIENFVLKFLIIWELFAFFLLIIGIITINNNEDILFIIIPTILIIFGIFLSVICFNYELNISKNDLKSMFNAKEM
jgi:hypothetical protein